MALDARNAYLRYLKVGQFGALSNRLVGPFSQGLNVVFGRNEAGKTTLFSFVDGVLFGWRDARGSQNTYKPETGTQTGALLFAARTASTAEAEGGTDGSGAEAEEGSAEREGAATNPEPLAGGTVEAELARARNTDGLQGDVALVDDIDVDTFRTMFALNSDELRSLRNTTDVTAKLLTAGSGTSTTPAMALKAIQEQMAEYTSRAQGAEHSLVQLAAERDEVKRAMEDAAAQMEQTRAHHRELHEAEPEHEAMRARMDEANRTIEHVQAARAGFERLAEEEAALRVELEALAEDERQAQADRAERAQAVGEKLAGLSSAEDASVRERIEALAARESKQEHVVDTARTNRNNSKAAHEALREALASDDADARVRIQRKTKVGVATVLTVAFLAVGVPVFMYGRSLPSLSYMLLGGVLVLAALALAGATLGMLLRRSKHDNAYEARLQDAQWVLLQDEKKLQACEADLARIRAEMAAELDAMGLGAAQGQPRRARVLLDEAKDARSQMALDDQRRQAAQLRANQVRDRLAAIKAERKALAERAGVEPTTSLDELDALLTRKMRDRTSLCETADAINRRIGELSQELAQAEQAHGFDRLKMQHQELVTRIKDAELGFARLILARQMLEAAIAAWESKSQPEVYQQASRLLALMTGGRWVQVQLTEAGALQVVDDARTVRDPRHLSMGTCQQLYLALRIALLTCADNVGRAIPILADDILVNFDAERRHGAACALAELAKSRQVLLFTCHEEVVAALQEADPDAAVLEL